MYINLTVIGQFITIFAAVVAVISYYLGRRKTETPVLAAVLGAVFSIVPIFGLIYLVVLMFKRDLVKEGKSRA
ncbi:hypothetical protein CLV83_4286 [Marinobacterium mangrovicola]|uniref:Uncharacterized protein n=1 Tax=Marinobacterium mangrovicola TaxID=1476959 RepID=A0A4R1G7S6_9GAMM|nr:hypothetical protein CLV83_4286 [Marinobacterium mangrovicola]